MDHDVGDLQAPARAQHPVDLVEHRVLVGHEVDDAVGDHDIDRRVGERQRLDQRFVQLDVRESHLAALARARSSIAAVMSTPIARPSGPVICAAISRSVPAPQPRSSTTCPGSMRPSVQWFATPAKLSTRRVGDARELGLGVAELPRPGAAGGEDELLLLVGRDLGVGLADLRRAGRRRRPGCRWCSSNREAFLPPGLKAAVEIGRAGEPELLQGHGGEARLVAVVADAAITWSSSPRCGGVAICAICDPVATRACCERCTSGSGDRVRPRRFATRHGCQIRVAPARIASSAAAGPSRVSERRACASRSSTAVRITDAVQPLGSDRRGIVGVGGDPLPDLRRRCAPSRGDRGRRARGTAGTAARRRLPRSGARTGTRWRACRSSSSSRGSLASCAAGPRAAIRASLPPVAGPCAPAARRRRTASCAYAQNGPRQYATTSRSAGSSASRSRAPRAGSSARRRCGRRRTPRSGERRRARRRPAQPRDQLVATDRLDVLAEVVARRALDLGQAGDRGVAQRQPQAQRLVSGERVAHARSLARACDHPRGVQRLQVLGGVGRRLIARPRELVDRPRRLGEQVEQLEPHAGWRTPCPSPRSPRTARPSRRGQLIRCYSIDHLIACQADGSDLLEVDVFFRQLLNDETACASYLLGCKTHSSSRSSTRTSTSSTTTSRSPRRRAPPIVAVLDTHVQADHVSGLPELVARTGATAYLPEGAGVEFDHHPLRDGEVVKLGNTEIAGDRHARARARAPRLPRHRPPPRRRAVVRAHRRRAAGRRRRPPGPARPRRAHRRGDGAHAVPVADRAAAGAARPPRAVSRRTTPARSAAVACRPTRSRRSASSAATTPRCSFDSEDEFVQALVSDIPPAPEQQAAIVAANRSGRPLADESRDHRAAGPAGAAREPRAVLAAGRDQRVRRRDGRARALDAAAHRPRELPPRLRAPRCCRSSSRSGSPRR